MRIDYKRRGQMSLLGSFHRSIQPKKNLLW